MSDAQLRYRVVYRQGRMNGVAFVSAESPYRAGVLVLEEGSQREVLSVSLDVRDPVSESRAKEAP